MGLGLPVEVGLRGAGQDRVLQPSHLQEGLSSAAACSGAARAPNWGPSTLPRGGGGIRGWKVLSDAFFKSPLVSEQHQSGFNKGLTEEKQLTKPSSAGPSSASCPSWVRAPGGDQLLGGW